MEVDDIEVASSAALLIRDLGIATGNGLVTFGENLLVRWGSAVDKFVTSPPFMNPLVKNISEAGKTKGDVILRGRVDLCMGLLIG